MPLVGTGKKAMGQVSKRGPDVSADIALVRGENCTPPEPADPKAGGGMDSGITEGTRKVVARRE